LPAIISFSGVGTDGAEGVHREIGDLCHSVISIVSIALYGDGRFDSAVCSIGRIPTFVRMLSRSAQSGVKRNFLAS
jgi:uncharacterized membrane protein YraQ (UPF0718 family)